MPAASEPKSGLGRRERGERRARTLAERRQAAPLLLGAAEREHGRGEEPSRGDQRAEAAVAEAQLLLDHALGQAVVDAAAAELLRQHVGGQADLGRLLPQIPGHARRRRPRRPRPRSGGSRAPRSPARAPAARAGHRRASRLTGLIARTYRTFGLHGIASAALARAACPYAPCDGRHLLHRRRRRSTAPSARTSARGRRTRSRPCWRRCCSRVRRGSATSPTSAQAPASSRASCCRTRSRSSRSSRRRRCARRSSRPCPRASRCSTAAPRRSRSTTHRSTSSPSAPRSTGSGPRPRSRRSRACCGRAGALVVANNEWRMDAAPWLAEVYKRARGRGRACGRRAGTGGARSRAPRSSTRRARRRKPHDQVLTPAAFIDLSRSLSSVNVLPPAERDAYLAEPASRSSTSSRRGPLVVPFRTRAVAARRRGVDRCPRPTRSRRCAATSTCSRARSARRSPSRRAPGCSRRSSASACSHARPASTRALPPARRCSRPSRELGEREQGLVVRAFSFYFLLVNLAEQHHRIRRLRLEAASGASARDPLGAGDRRDPRRGRLGGASCASAPRACGSSRC